MFKPPQLDLFAISLSDGLDKAIGDHQANLVIHMQYVHIHYNNTIDNLILVLQILQGIFSLNFSFSQVFRSIIALSRHGQSGPEVPLLCGKPEAHGLGSRDSRGLTLLVHTQGVERLRPVDPEQLPGLVEVVTCPVGRELADDVFLLLGHLRGPNVSMCLFRQ